MNDYERGMLLVMQSLAKKDGTPFAPVSPEAGRLWKDLDGVVWSYTGKEWVKTGVEMQK